MHTRGTVVNVRHPPDRNVVKIYADYLRILLVDMRIYSPLCRPPGTHYFLSHIFRFTAPAPTFVAVIAV